MYIVIAIRFEIYRRALKNFPHSIDTACLQQREREREIEKASEHRVISTHCLLFLIFSILIFVRN